MTIDTLSAAERNVLLNTASLHGKSHDNVWYRQPPPWKSRSNVVARWIGKNPAYSEFTDIGCGSMYLKTLVPHLHYVPCDFAARSPDMIVIDLNKDDLPLTWTKAATALGLIEYLYDPIGFIRSLRQYDHVTISYNHKSFKESRTKRLTHFWVNHLTRREFKRALTDNGWKIVRWRYLKLAECLYQIERIDRTK